jgi:hypothetical protein
MGNKNLRQTMINGSIGSTNQTGLFEEQACSKMFQLLHKNSQNSQFLSYCSITLVTALGSMPTSVITHLYTGMLFAIA